MNGLKINFSGEIRRVPFPVPKPTWEQLHILLRTIFVEKYHPEIQITYLDEEGDQITMNTDIEWSSAYDYLAAQPLPRLNISLPEFPFSEGPPPVPLYFYQQNNQQSQQPISTIPINSAASPNLRSISQDLPALLEDILGHKLLPFNLPDWIRPAIQLFKNSQNVVDLDINLEVLSTVLHRYALSELDDQRHDSARKLLLAQLCIEPTSQLALYNLACTEALAGKPAEAVEYLSRAVKNGYNRLEHMLGDSDLKSIHGHPEFVRIVNELSLQQLHTQVGGMKI
eukprot:TRINITY_DN12599_c0_g1_i1.p1 TRINITY_DN12599_c0_g1~~TRINITY_DN12599_c0_g1_i1.p1  ORF type:complete len:283 (+),score=52.19 TRINITY_DN12599_c0_g1_i1:19-867(+)